MSIPMGERSRTVAPTRAGATVVWLLALLPWLAALQHLGTLPAEAARQNLADGQPWPGLLTARVVGVMAVGIAVIGACLIAPRAPHLVASLLVVLALAMGWIVRPLGRLARAQRVWHGPRRCRRVARPTFRPAACHLTRACS
jgi:hypothetical protein